jgi:hypothetical protein
MGQHAGRFARKLARRQLAETKVRHRVPELIRLQCHRHLGDSDVRRAREYCRQADPTEIARVLDLLRTNNDKTRSRIDNTGRPVLTALERGRSDERLDTRARFKDVRDRAVSIAFGRQLRTIVRVVSGLVDHGEDLAGLDVQHDDRTRARIVFPDSTFQRAISQVLKAKIDTRAKILARIRRPYAGNIFDRSAKAVLEHALGARLAGKPGIVGKLKTFLPDVIDVRESHEVAGHFRCRVVAAVLALHVDAG